MKAEELKESIEKVHEFVHEAGHKKEWWMPYVALTTTIIAVLAAISGLIGNMATSKSILSKNDAVLFQSKASNLWAYYQAKSIKSNMYEIEARVYTSHANEFSKEVARYDAEKDKIRIQAEEAEQKTEEANRLSEHYYNKHHIISFAETFLQMAIALSAISLLTRRRLFWWISLLFSVAGIGFFVSAMRL